MMPLSWIRRSPSHMSKATVSASFQGIGPSFFNFLDSVTRFRVDQIPRVVKNELVCRRTGKAIIAGTRYPAGAEPTFHRDHPMKAALHTGATVPVEFKDQQQLDPRLANYLAEPGPHCLEIGAGWNSRPGWLTTDLNPPPGHACIRLDATKSFEIPSDSFDFVYSEHMIEHVTDLTTKTC